MVDGHELTMLRYMEFVCVCVYSKTAEINLFSSESKPDKDLCLSLVCCICRSVMLP